VSFIYLDTHIIIWGVKNESSPGQEVMIQRTNELLASLDSKLVAIPAVVVGELLLCLPIAAHPEFLDKISKNFVIHPYDAAAARRAAEVWITAKNAGAVKAIQDDGKSRETIKADCQIIGIALSRNGTCIYSHDDDIRRLAGSLIQVRLVPELQPLQYPLLQTPS